MSGDAATRSSNSSSCRERYRAIPEELRCLKQWGLHKNRRRLVIRDGELVSTEWTYLPDWMSFDDALRALESYPGAADGLVFYLCPEILDEIPQVVALKFDCCRDPTTGEIIQWARELIQRIQPFYTEISASGTDLVGFVMVRVSIECAAVYSIDNSGPVDTNIVKSIAKAKAIPYAKVRPKLNILFKMTSVRVTGNKIEDLCYASGDRTYDFSSVVLLHEFDKVMRTSINNASQLSEYAQIPIERIVDIGEFSIADGYRRGPHPAHESTGKDFIVDTERGLWYCYQHQTGGDAWMLLAVIDGVLDCKDVHSGVLKGDVLKNTVTAAYARELITDEQARTLAGNSDSDNSDIITFEDVTKLVKTSYGEEPKFSPTNAANAILTKMRVAVSENDTSRDSEIYVFNGMIWQPDGEREIIKLLNRAAGDLSTKHAREETLVRVRTEAPRVRFNQVPYLYPLKNGVLDLSTGEFRDYREDDYLTFQVPIEFTPDADFRPFLWHLCSTLPTIQDVVASIDLTVVYLIRYPFEIITLLQGGGGNGKSIFIECLSSLVPEERLTAISFSEVKSSRFGAGNLLNKDLWVVDEVRSAKEVMDLIKRTSSGGFLDSDVKYARKRARGKPHVKLVMSSNHTIEFDDESRGVTRRLVKLDFPYTFGQGSNDRPKNPDWGEFLKRKENLAGILRLASWRGPAIWKTKKIYRRKSEEQIAAELEKQQHHLSSFCKDCIDTVPPEMINMYRPVTAKDLYNEYLEYCKLFNVPTPANENVFGRHIKKEFDIKSASTTLEGKSVRVYRGIYIAQTARLAHEVFLASYDDGRASRNYRSTTDSATKTTNLSPETTELLQIYGSTDIETTDPMTFLVIDAIVRMWTYIQQSDPADISYEKFLQRTAESVVSIAGDAAICSGSVAESVISLAGDYAQN